jgi:hypothetical protein
MIIEARLRQLRCLPTHGGVRVADFISTWHVSINQMEAAGFLPGLQQLLSVFADGLPNNTVAFINLYDNIMLCLNDPDDNTLQNIHHIFDCTINIDNNIQRNRIMHPSNAHHLQQLAPSSSSSATTVAPPAADTQAQAQRSNPVAATIVCGNCGRSGHTDLTCFQPVGAMEGRRDEYLANRVSRPVAHIAEIEGMVEVDESTVVTMEDAFINEFAAMSLKIPNEIHFSTYVLSSIAELLPDQSLALGSISQSFHSALDLACTNHIFRDHNLFHTYSTDNAVPVKTANCGILNTLGMGTVKVKLSIKHRTVIWTLKNCLHALDVPINLISVGALQEHHMSVVFSFNRTTISFPENHQHLSGLSFDAHITHRLSLISV